MRALRKILVEDAKDAVCEALAVVGMITMAYVIYVCLWTVFA